MSRRKQSRPRHVDEGVAGDPFSSSAPDGDHEKHLGALVEPEDDHQMALLALKSRAANVTTGDDNMEEDEEDVDDGDDIDDEDHQAQGISHTPPPAEGM